MKVGGCGKTTQSRRYMETTTIYIYMYSYACIVCTVGACLLKRVLQRWKCCFSVGTYLIEIGVCDILYYRYIYIYGI